MTDEIGSIIMELLQECLLPSRSPKIADPDVGKTQPIMCIGEAGVDPDRLLEMRCRFLIGSGSSG